MNDLSVANALAERLRIWGEPAEEQALATVYPVPPNTIGTWPSIIIYPDADTITYGASTRITTLSYRIRLYLRPNADLTRRLTTLLRWRSHLRTAFDGNASLGGLVDAVNVTQTSLGDEEYAGEPMVYAEATVEVIKVDVITVS
jgi:hypothetical protein